MQLMTPDSGDVRPEGAPDSHNRRDKAQQDDEGGSTPARPRPAALCLGQNQRRVDPANGHSSRRAGDGLQQYMSAQKLSSVSC